MSPIEWVAVAIGAACVLAVVYIGICVVAILGAERGGP